MGLPLFLFNPNRSLDRNVLISIVILLLLAVYHKNIIRLSPNDRFRFKDVDYIMDMLI